MRILAFFLLLFGLYGTQAEAAAPESLKKLWPDTDFSKASVDLADIMAGGPPKDGIPAIDNPIFEAVKASDLPENEPVIGLVINGVARAYPLRILTWHEIVNDEVGGVPVTVTYCPLCNSAVVYERKIEGTDKATTFGTSGMLMNSNLVMYDRASETWWQQFTGTAIVGKHMGTKLRKRPARLESFAQFKKRFPKGQVLIPNNPKARPYGNNPYKGYDSARKPFLYRGDLPTGVPAMTRVVAVGDTAYALTLIRDEKTVMDGDIRLRYEGDHASALDAREITASRPVAGVSVQKRDADGQWEDIPYDVTFAFVFHAFKPKGKWKFTP
ncbi:MAG: hypothetical protein COA84_06085 [Robiginitomaculum sp.]|nr:MAG: hypothetical protein COA84_06085 [Robiginitomaculum sp.]